ncbi:MAG: hypothetical protein PVJ52_00565 [Candidatus Woesebacteria bacterium]|jgi:hypothetical protein
MKEKKLPGIIEGPVMPPGLIEGGNGETDVHGFLSVRVLLDVRKILATTGQNMNGEKISKVELEEKIFKIDNYLEGCLEAQKDSLEPELAQKARGILDSRNGRGSGSGNTTG